MMSCPRCPHCIASGTFGLIDPKDPALTTNLPGKEQKPKRCCCGHVAGAHAKRTGDCWAVMDGGARDCRCKKFKEPIA